jgi:putative proteasome-type protease
MTYCVALRLKEGLVFASDSRTNAGIDHVSTFRKMHIFQTVGSRSIVMLSAGNLATSQAVISSLCEQATENEAEHVYNAKSMYRIAQLVGAALRDQIHDQVAGQQVAGSVDFNCSFLLGGQLEGETPRLFYVYPAGNFIEATEDTPYFQIGEVKYGKPIIDRMIDYELPISLAMKVVLISFDSTMHSNASVGMPIDIATYREDAFSLTVERLEADNKYFTKLSHAWAAGMRKAFDELP